MILVCAELQRMSRELHKVVTNRKCLTKTVFYHSFLSKGLISPEYDALQIKWIFNNARGRDSNPQHILLRRKIGWLGDPVQCVQVTKEAANKSIPTSVVIIKNQNIVFEALFSFILTIL